MISCLELWKKSKSNLIPFYLLQKFNKESSHLLNLCMKLQMLKTILFWLNVVHSVLGIYILLTEQGSVRERKI